MSEPRATLKKLIEARNESNAEVRGRLLDESFAEEGVLDDSAEYRGRAGLTTLIENEIVDPEHWVALKSGPSPIGNRFVFRWRILRSVGKPQDQLCWLELDEDEKIRRLTVHHTVTAPPSVPAQMLAWAKDHPAPALAALAGVLYAVLRLSMALFYNQLGLAPEQVGLANDELLRQSLTMLGALVFLGLVVTIVNWLTFVPGVRLVAVARRLALAGRTGERRLVLGLAAAPFVVFAVFFAVSLFENELTNILVAEGALALCVLLVPRAVLLLPAARRVTPLADEAMRRSRQFNPQSVLASLLGVVVSGLLVTLPAIAYTTATEVKDGAAATARLFPWRALPAEVRWTTRQPPVEISNDCRDLRFLGEDGDQTYFYAWRSSRTLRIPSEDLVVSIVDDC